MTYEEVMEALAGMGTEQTKKTYIRHGAKEPFFGVKIGDMKKLVKPVKKDQQLALQLYESGNYDAMYLSGLTINPKMITKAELQKWVQKAYWHALAEYTVAGVAAESAYAHELAVEWIESEEELIAVCGWSTYSNYVSITPDEELNIEEIRNYLARVRTTIHSERNRVRYSMNQFVISVGAYLQELTEEAKAAGEAIGKVHVDVGDTACKVPLAKAYIEKIETMGRIGSKKKTCIC
ncbi:DNA alkylation repair protein [Paenibacillus gorillae]|uniref:DNA alkylation repair protein n=1 Tax=Paenibacillus gorillae TaxID=1243662 RepID=UPI0004B2B993|nr:DNA alkylation repair protein [Paenibacillus gorillae]